MPDIKPLSARSVVLSLALGAHPRAMTSRELSTAGTHLGVPASGVRVALTRAVAAGELRREGPLYVLGPHLLDRQSRQEQRVSEDPWDGRWETAVVVVTGRSGAARAALRTTLTDARLGELREGVWMRPANLDRDPPRSPVLRTFVATPDDDPAAIAAELWDLGSWARETTATLELLEVTHTPPERLAVAAHLVRQLAADPLLPAEVSPPGWPAVRARAAYESYRDELRRLGDRDPVTTR